MEDECTRTNRNWLPGLAWICMHSRMASPNEPVSHCIRPHRFWRRSFSNSHNDRRHGARLDSVALVLDGLLRRCLRGRWLELRYWILANVGGVCFGADVCRLDINDPFAGSHCKAGAGQLVGRLHCRCALRRLLGACWECKRFEL